MAILKIARMGQPVLLQPALPVENPGDADIRRLVADMIETMEDARGIGLAAPQVHVSLQVMVFRVPAGRVSGEAEDTPTGTVVLINPTVEAIGEESRLRWEGCLSIPGLRGAVPRPWRVRYRGVDCDGQVIERVASGLHAGVVQHEFDHLAGILYPMRMQDLSRFGFNEELERAASPGAPSAGSPSGGAS